jgi:hypothetical protein
MYSQNAYTPSRSCSQWIRAHTETHKKKTTTTTLQITPQQSNPFRIAHNTENASIHTHPESTHKTTLKNSSEPLTPLGTTRNCSEPHVDQRRVNAEPRTIHSRLLAEFSPKHPKVPETLQKSRSEAHTRNTSPQEFTTGHTYCAQLTPDSLILVRYLHSESLDPSHALASTQPSLRVHSARQ